MINVSWGLTITYGGGFSGTFALTHSSKSVLRVQLGEASATYANFNLIGNNIGSTIFNGTDLRAIDVNQFWFYGYTMFWGGTCDEIRVLWVLGGFYVNEVTTFNFLLYKGPRFFGGNGARLFQ